MKKQQNIILIGPMGAGKTTVGRYLAQQLNREFYDSDQVIEERTGVDIAWIFDIEGEAGFRQREEQAIEELTMLQGIVLATGGGVILSSKNRTNLAARGVVVYLDASIEQQLSRMEKDRRRPLLQTDDRAAKLLDLREERDPLYREIADYIFSTDGQGVKSVAQHVLQTLLDDSLSPH